MANPKYALRNNLHWPRALLNNDWKKQIYKKTKLARGKCRIYMLANNFAVESEEESDLDKKRRAGIDKA
jgi:hypothetical protein